MEKIWLSEYPPGVPPEISVDPAESLLDMLDRACGRFAGRPAFSNFGSTISFAEFDDLSRRLAVWLQGLPGVGPGDRVAIMLPNLLQYPVALAGVWRAGMVVVNINPLYTAEELAHQLADSGAKVLIQVRHQAGTYAEAAAHASVRHLLLTGVGDMLDFPRGPLVNFAIRYVRRLGRRYALPGASSWRDVMRQEPGRWQRPRNVNAAALACLQYTGGTTGRSKGAMLSHGNLVANVRQINTWFGGLYQPGEETVLTPLPLYHVYALTCNCLCYIDMGGHDILITDPRDIRGLIAEMRRWKFTGMTAVNTLYEALARHPDIGSVDFSSLKIASAGGMAVLETTAQRWVSVTGVPLREGYGLSETSPVLTINSPAETNYTGSIGLPLPSTELSLRDEHGREVAIGQPGEICARGPQVMSAYWNGPEETAACMTSDGFFRTGDIAVVDARGYFRIVDRKKDMIDVSGLKVYPNEVENAAAKHPEVLEAACIGVPDERTGEAVKVFLVPKPGRTLSADEVRDYLRGHLAPYKIPKHVEFRDTLPKSNVGKILRRALREHAH
jgi:long-chain acyl-CoA synthetase